MSDLYHADKHEEYSLGFVNGVTEKSWVNHCSNTRSKAETEVLLACRKESYVL